MSDERRKKKKSNNMLKLIVGFTAVKIYKKRGNIQATYRNLKRLHPLYYKKSSYHYNLFKLAYKQELWKQSLDHINTAINRSKKSLNVNYYLSKAKTLVQLNQSLKATIYLKEILNEEPNNETALRLLGNEFYKLGQWNDAIENFELYLSQKPKHSKISFK